MNKELIEKINEEITTKELIEMVQELNSWDGSMDWLEYMENDEDFFEVYFKDKIEVARAVCYGEYNFTDDLVRFNAYGNLESCSYYEREKKIEEDYEEIIENYVEKIDDIESFSCNDELIKKIKNIIEEFEEKQEA